MVVLKEAERIFEVLHLHHQVFVSLLRALLCKLTLQLAATVVKVNPGSEHGTLNSKNQFPLCSPQEQAVHTDLVLWQEWPR